MASNKQMRVVLNEATWERLNREKKAGEDFDNVVNRLLDLKVSNETYKAVMKIAKEGETFDTVIRLLLDQWEETTE